MSRILGRLEPSEASDQATLSTSKLKKPCASTSHGSGQGKLRKIREIKMPNLNPRTFSINPGIFVEASRSSGQIYPVSSACNNSIPLLPLQALATSREKPAWPRSVQRDAFVLVSRHCPTACVSCPLKIPDTPHLPLPELSKKPAE